MTVRELIELLQERDPELTVTILTYQGRVYDIGIFYDESRKEIVLSD